MLRRMFKEQAVMLFDKESVDKPRLATIKS